MKIAVQLRPTYHFIAVLDERVRQLRVKRDVAVGEIWDEEQRLSSRRSLNDRQYAKAKEQQRRG